MAKYEYTPEKKEELAHFLDTHPLSAGLGSEARPCSIAAVNIVLSGGFHDRVPECMSFIIGKLIIVLQDAMPSEFRNSQEWKSMLVDAVGTGREKEEIRMAMVLAWMWGCMIPLQEVATKNGFGDQWANMLEERTSEAADEAATYRAEQICIARGTAFGAGLDPTRQDREIGDMAVQQAARHASLAVKPLSQTLGKVRDAQILNHVDKVIENIIEVEIPYCSDVEFSTWWRDVINPVALLRRLIHA
jgi:hypothetical protein